MIEAEVVKTDTGSYVRCAQESEPVSQERDILDLIGCCSDPGRILLNEQHLHGDFFDLSTGLAGAILGKTAQYRVKTVVVADMDGIKSERFHELIYEMNKGEQVNFFPELETAERWLTAG